MLHNLFIYRSKVLKDSCMTSIHHTYTTENWLVSTLLLFTIYFYGKLLTESKVGKSHNAVFQYLEIFISLINKLRSSRWCSYFIRLFVLFMSNKFQSKNNNLLIELFESSTQKELTNLMNNFIKKLII